jgi:hypothetical protein
VRPSLVPVITGVFPGDAVLTSPTCASTVHIGGRKCHQVAIFGTTTVNCLLMRGAALATVAEQVAITSVVKLCTTGTGLHTAHVDKCSHPSSCSRAYASPRSARRR